MAIHVLRMCRWEVVGCRRPVAIVRMIGYPVMYLLCVV